MIAPMNTVSYKGTPQRQVGKFSEIEELQQHVFLQQYYEPLHRGTIVRRSLNDNFRGRWIRRGGRIPWPIRSPDITPLD
ncbi:uncharacterized protein NPIL_207571 [Nephila pilipes]|uniref:Uncharacterized protein n=1 Tax=Nephila pilipes TaxID=299642 RepID=A0A8X6UTE1_NEPPI|nr:uncharacterized protein NPIL_207571 [Nephila pilipes]